MKTYHVITVTGSFAVVIADKFIVDHPDKVRFLLNGEDIAFFNSPISIIRQPDPTTGEPNA